MNSRESTMALALIALLLVGGAVCGYMFVYNPLQDKKAAANKLQGEVDDLDQKMLAARKDAAAVAEIKRASLPPDAVSPREANKTPLFNVARSQYKFLLEHLL